MTDTWVPAPPQPPSPNPPEGLPPPNSWSPVTPCASADAPSIADGVIITGRPAVINASLWQITVNDGQNPANFSIDHFDATGALIDHPMFISGVDGSIDFNNPVYLAQDPVAPLEAATKEYVDAKAGGLPDAPTDGALYGRASGAWATAYSTTNPANYQTAAQVTAAVAPMMPRSGALPFTGAVQFNAGAIFAAPNILAIGGGLTGQVLAANAGGTLAWAASLPEAPTDGQQYARQNAAWFPVAGGGGGGIAGAPNDGTAYARKSAAWAHLTHTDITDWTATLSPYALITSVPIASATLPLPSGVGAIGTSTTYARADHVHPGDAYSHDNRIINGDMRIDQRNNGASGTANGYTVDRWWVASSPASHFTWGRNLNALLPLNATGFPYYLGLQSTSAYTAAAGDSFQLFQAIEADMISDFGWGASNANPVTLSFWAYSSLTGTFSGAIRNYVCTRSYPFTYSIPIANTWTKIVVTIPGDTAAAMWQMNTNAGSLYLTFDLGSGSTARGPANAWATTVSPGYIGATGSVSVVAVNAATFYVTGVKLEVGSVATPFNRQSLAKSMVDCQRYFQVVSGSVRGYANVANAALSSTLNFLNMRAAPTVTTFSLPSNGNVSTYIIASIANNGARLEVTATAAGDTFSVAGQYSMSAEL